MPCTFERPAVSVIVVGDRKTPEAAREFCEALGRRFPYPVTFLGIAEQMRYLAGYPELASHLPWDSHPAPPDRSPARLRARRRRHHHHRRRQLPGRAGLRRPSRHRRPPVTLDAFSAPRGLGECLRLPRRSAWLPLLPPRLPARAARAAGGPRPRRRPRRPAGGRERRPLAGGARHRRGDAAGRARPHHGIHPVGQLRAGPGTWSPFNSQNTALHRDVIPAYFLSPRTGRYDDIWASYVVDAIAGHLGDLIAFGHPLVRQERNPHDLWRDLDQERPGMRLTDALVARPPRASPSRGTTYARCFAEAADGLRDALARRRRASTRRGRAPTSRGSWRGCGVDGHAWRGSRPRRHRTRPHGRAPPRAPSSDGPLESPVASDAVRT